MCVLDFKSGGSPSALSLPSAHQLLCRIRDCGVGRGRVGEERRGEEEDEAYLGRINVSTDLP